MDGWSCLYKCSSCLSHNIKNRCCDCVRVFAQVPKKFSLVYNMCLFREQMRVGFYMRTERHHSQGYCLEKQPETKHGSRRQKEHRLYLKGSVAF